MMICARATAKGGAALVLMLLLSACQTELYTAVPEQEANEMLALLLRGGVSASKVQAKDGSDTLMVEQTQFAAAVDMLHTGGYPRAKFSTINDVFQPSGLIASPVQEQARFIWALGQELSRTVSQIDGVLTARVQVVLPDNDLLKREPTPSSASVFIRYDEASRVASLVSQIKMLVANSVQGLNYDKVSVVLVPVPHVDLPVRLAAPTPDWQGPALIGGGVVPVLVAFLLLFRRRLLALIATTKPPLPDPAE
ncbi:type III secretion inner membrane ring lipoprotein SctJ [Lichenihabitans sp. PAMC28606]|uniref:type III secretion system inner membrane ring lipoprotein SctJ n=1 Tax=Lichenihabitans sp. PAMC28606 TaxID=2880932 RepID=UPI001D09BA66|nr:type III secretion inner membrane ring lipoprotein SctJ [Lichenihabitans sp. PAMC28606]UDL94596.1 type III secretion inner membrane ring lipoprotein SctJ [Lichenihabitans sp. PAMC28606]